MGLTPWMALVLEMTRTVLSWPSVALIMFVTLIAKTRRLSFKDFADMAGRFGRVAISSKGIEFEFVGSFPTEEQLLEELPYTKSDRSVPPGGPPAYSPPKRRFSSRDE
jgi:hypothetical protein